MAPDKTLPDPTFWRRFILAFVAVVGVNLLSYFSTWYTGDYVTAGVPFTFYGFGGLSGDGEFLPHYLLADVAIAVIVAYIAARLPRFGSRRIQTRGLDDAT